MTQDFQIAARHAPTGKPMVACFIPTCCGAQDLPHLLDSLALQDVAFDVYVVDSSSDDGTAEIARDRGVFVESIPRTAFNHGGTRQMMAGEHPDYEILVYLTQDVRLNDPTSMRRLLEPFADSQTGAAGGRQLPGVQATALARHARFFNYPAESRVISAENMAEFGLKSAFLSNSFAAYRAKALRQVGGFPDNVIMCEDQYVAAKLLLAGWRIVYASEAVCLHSHNYTVAEEFRRYFDLGVFFRREDWIGRSLGSANREGLRFVISELRFLGWRRLFLWPEALVRTAAKFIAFKLAAFEKKIPHSLKESLSMHRSFWHQSSAPPIHDQIKV